MPRITQEDLLHYIYGESSNEKKAAIKSALETNWRLKEQFNNLLSAKENLPKISISPRKKSIDNILEYAAKKEQAKVFIGE